MTELKVFRPRSARVQAISFPFDTASLALFASLTRRPLAVSPSRPLITAAVAVPLSSEWRDPAKVRLAQVAPLSLLAPVAA